MFPQQTTRIGNAYCHKIHTVGGINRIPLIVSFFFSAILYHYRLIETISAPIIIIGQKSTERLL